MRWRKELVGFEKPSKMPAYRILTKSDIEAIHWTSLDVLENTGIKIIKGESILKMLKDKGCTVDFKKETVYFSPSIVEESIRKASKIVTVYSPRNPKYDHKIDGRHIYFGTDGLCINTTDLETGEWRPSTSDDVARITRVTDALDSYPSAGGMTASFEKPEYIRGAYDTVTRLNNTEKHTGFSLGNVESPELARSLFDYQLEMARVVAGGEEALRKRPFLGGGFYAMSPLQFHSLYVEQTLRLAELGSPSFVGSMAQAGATAPVTQAGILVVTNAEVLGGISIIQLAYPGTQVSTNYFPASFDQRYGKWAAGAPEEALLNAASVEITRHYGLNAVVTGLATSANVPGPQACIEKVISAIFPILSGADVVAGAGGLGCSMTASLEQLVVDDELCKAMLTPLQGIEINDDTLAIDIIHNVGPGGQYLDQKHTLHHFKKEHFMPDLIDRSPYEVWKKAGAKDLIKRAKDRVKKILKEHSVPPLDKDVQNELHRIIKKAEKELGSKTKA